MASVLLEKRAAPVYAPFIVIPPLTSCEPSFLVFGQGVAPYNIFPVATGSTTGASLETIPTQASAGAFQWTVDFDPGANITFAVVDSTGAVAYSGFRVVQVGTGATCPKNTYTPATVTPVGAIVGGVLGALAFVALAVAFYFLARRRARRLKSLPSRSTSPEFETLEAGDGVRRAGTFNLGSVAFTEPSMERLREMDHPPVYVHKRNTITGVTIPTTPEEDVEAYERRTAAGTEGAAVPATVEETAAGAETETRTTVA